MAVTIRPGSDSESALLVAHAPRCLVNRRAAQIFLGMGTPTPAPNEPLATCTPGSAAETRKISQCAASARTYNKPPCADPPRRRCGLPGDSVGAARVARPHSAMHAASASARRGPYRRRRCRHCPRHWPAQNSTPHPVAAPLHPQRRPFVCFDATAAAARCAAMSVRTALNAPSTGVARWHASAASAASPAGRSTHPTISMPSRGRCAPEPYTRTRMHTGVRGSISSRT